MTIAKKKVPNPIDVLVGVKVRLFRTSKGMSQEQLGNALGITFQQVQKYEKGSNRISASKLQTIASVLSVNIEDFFEASEKSLVEGASSFVPTKRVLHIAHQLSLLSTKKLNALGVLIPELRNLPD